MPNKPKPYDGATRPDETPKTFAELKPPGYWSATLGYFVPVRIVSDDEQAMPKDTQPDDRLSALPDSRALINSWDSKMKAPLPSMQLWEVDGEPVVTEQNGDCRVFSQGKWWAGDPWECLSGKPMSYRLFEERWPGLVSVDEYLASFEGG